MRTEAARPGRTSPAGKRSTAIAPLLSLGVLTVALVSGPGALATTTSAEHVGTPTQVASVETITIDDLRDLVDQFVESGEVTRSGSGRLNVSLDMAGFYIDLGYPQRAIRGLELFKQVAADETRVLTENARDTLIAAAGRLIAHLSA